MMRYNIFSASSVILITILFAGINSCVEPGIEKKKVVYINSYHSGFPPTDEITSGVIENLPADSFEVVTHFMDTKRNPSLEYIMNRAEELLDTIKAEDPDLLIVSDDNAVKYLVEPHPQEIDMPVVFCGVNWSAKQYDLSEHNSTGILEILPVFELMQTMKSHYPSMQNVLVLNENTTTSRKTRPLLDTLGNSIGLEVTQQLVDDFDSWKAVFKEANQSYDIIYLQTMGAINNWNHEEALKFIDEHIKVPLVTCESFMMPYAVFGLTEISKEQGVRAAEAAKKILKGANPTQIPVSRNTMTKIWLNTRLADKINFQPDEAILSKATEVK